MFKCVALRHRPLFFLGVFSVLSQPINADESVQKDLGQGPMLTGYTTVASWEEYKRIRQKKNSGGATATDSDGSDAEVGHEISPNDTSAESPVQKRKKPPLPTAQQGTQTKQAKKVIQKSEAGKPAPEQITAPAKPTVQGDWWAFYSGKMLIHANPYYGSHGIDFKWAYARKDPLPKDPRIVVNMHGSGGGESSMEVFGPSPKGDIEERTQDAEAYSENWREWWTFGGDGKPYPGRRIAAVLEFLTKRYQIDPSKRGLVLEGTSMGGTGAVIQTMILPDPWRGLIAYSSGVIGPIMPRQIAKRDPGQYITLPPDNDDSLWDSIDFSIQAAVDPIVRGIHYRHLFSSEDQFSTGLHGNTQFEFVNLIEKNKIGGAFTWIKANHWIGEEGVNLPADISAFEAPEQDVTLDRAHPAITNSTGNHPLRAADRVNEAKYPRGHYNMGITWDHAKIVDEASQIIFPLKYTRRTGIGKGVPDQPMKITISVTPRRPKNFKLMDGETLKWKWNGGTLSGLAKVNGDTVTIDKIPLVSGDKYKMLRIYR